MKVLIILLLALITYTQANLCVASGDPHYRAFNGRAFNNYHRGDWLFAQTRLFKVGIRTRAWYHASVTTRVSVKTGRLHFVFGRGQNDYFRVNGRVYRPHRGWRNIGHVRVHQVGSHITLVRGNERIVVQGAYNAGWARNKNLQSHYFNVLMTASGASRGLCNNGQQIHYNPFGTSHIVHHHVHLTTHCSHRHFVQAKARCIARRFQNRIHLNNCIFDTCRGLRASASRRFYNLENRYKRLYMMWSRRHHHHLALSRRYLSIARSHLARLRRSQAYMRHHTNYMRHHANYMRHHAHYVRVHRANYIRYRNAALRALRTSRHYRNLRAHAMNNYKRMLRLKAHFWSLYYRRFVQLRRTGNVLFHRIIVTRNHVLRQWANRIHHLIRLRHVSFIRFSNIIKRTNLSFRRRIAHLAHLQRITYTRLAHQRLAHHRAYTRQIINSRKHRHHLGHVYLHRAINTRNHYYRAAHLNLVHGHRSNAKYHRLAVLYLRRYHNYNRLSNHYNHLYRVYQARAVAQRNAMNAHHRAHLAHMRAYHAHHRAYLAHRRNYLNSSRLYRHYLSLHHIHKEML
jgi:hypothetical protein